MGNADYILSMASTLSNARPVFIGRRSKGTLAAPLSMANNDFIMSFLSSAYDGTAFQNPAAIDFFVDGTPTAGSVPARISFVTGSNSSNRAERLKIGNTGDITMNTNQFFLQRSTGNVGFGTISPTAKIEVAGQVKITGGGPAAGKVLTSDAAGLATWQTVPVVAETDPEVAVTDTSAVPRWNGTALVNGTIKDNGIKVGIGTATPTAKLDVTGNVKIADGTQGVGKVLTSDATGLSTWQDIPAPVETDPQVSAATTNQIPKWNGTTLADGTITDNGNVGIGEANPQGILHVSQPFNFAGVSFAGTGVNDLAVNNGGYTGTGTNTYVIRIQNPGPNPNIIEVSNDGGSTFAAPVAIANPISLSNGVSANFAATGGHNFGDTWTWSVSPSFNNILVAKNGKTGIGTASPNATLDIAGNLKIADGTQGAGKILTSDPAGLASWTMPAPNTWTVLGANIYNNNTGNVGIGTTTPGAKLDVNGDALINGLKTGKGGGNVTTNTAFGMNALDSNNIGGTNTAIGYQTLGYNTSGRSNTGIGSSALFSNTSGFSNVAMGNNALRNNTTGSNLVAIGDSALVNQNGGFGYNTAVGSKALFSNTTGSFNSCNGWGTLYSNTTGNYNTANGLAALYFNTTGVKNTANGYHALSNNTTGGGNTANGADALYQNNIGNYNTADGYEALYANTTGENNTANGAETLLFNTTGNNNTANGKGALRANINGNLNTANGANALALNTVGSNNVANGGSALLFNNGSSNTANGAEALYFNTTGSSNVAMGINALRNNTTGSNLVAIGDSALFNQDGGLGYNTAVGSKALYSSSIGSYNSANGAVALFSNTSGSYNTANGSRALYSNTTGFYNTANGASALYSNTTGANNTANGENALSSNTTGGYNTANGKVALYSNSTGDNNVATGSGALYGNTTGSNNTAFGRNALVSNTTGYSNVAVGVVALYKNTKGKNLVAVGDSALYKMNGGFGANTALGSKVLFANTTGGYNTAAGSMALTANSTGSLNTAFGKDALLANTTGSNNTALGYNANVSTGALTNSTVIGANATVNASDKMQLGSSTTTLASTGGITIVSDGRFKDNVKAEDVPGLAFINNLKPVAYNFNYKGFDDFLRKDIKKDKSTATDTGYQQRLKAKGEIREVGFIAQEVNNLIKDKGYTFNGVYTPQNANDNYALDYSRFVVPLVKAVQELSAKNEQLTVNNEQLKAKATELDILKQKVAALETMMQQLLNNKSNAPCPPLAGK